MLNSLESKFKLSLGIVLSSFLINYFSDSSYSNRLLEEYYNKPFSLEENYSKHIDELPIDLNNDGEYDGVFMTFDLNKKAWKKSKIESMAYFQYADMTEKNLEPYAKFFCTFNKGNIENVNGELMDSDWNDSLEDKLGVRFVKALLTSFKETSSRAPNPRGKK